MIFRDPVAADLIGRPGAEMVGYHQRSGDHIVLAGTRAQVTVRSRYTEQRLAELADRGLDQYVVLGAGLDSFAYRSPLAARLRTFEVDHPASQHWKRQLLVAAHLTPPDGLALLAALLDDHGLTVTDQARQRDAVPAALWDRSDALRPLDLCRLARAVVSP